MFKSTSRATGMRALSRSRIGLIRDELRHTAYLLDDVVALAPGHDRLDVHRFVAGVDGEPMRLRAELLVLQVAHGDALATGGVPTFADQVEWLRRQREALGEVFDPLVHLAKHGLVQADALLTTSHRTPSSGGFLYEDVYISTRDDLADRPLSRFVPDRGHELPRLFAHSGVLTPREAEDL